MNSKGTRRILPLVIILALAGVFLTALAQGSSRSLLPVVVRGPASGGLPVAKINFQPATAVVPTGYLADTGAIFGDRGNGFFYGWNADNSATTRERDSAFAFDQRYDTLIHLQRPENPAAVWEIALPVGIYEVYLVAGDPEFFDGRMQTLVEGVPAVDGAPSSDRRFISGTATVTVQDGRMTVTNGPAAQNNKLLFLEIYKVGDAPAPTPTPTRPPSMVEFRGLWVTRFDWTVFNRPADPVRIDQIVNNAADAGFNAIFFQVRATADAYYTPGLEPWAQRVSGGTLGQPPSPMWDPLAYFIQKAQQRGLQVHAYVNVYPVADRTGTNECPPPPLVSPKPLYFLLQEAHGTTDGRPNGVQWLVSDEPYCGDYLYASPASPVFRNHFKAVVADLVNRYDIDGIHLDRVRYAGRSTSCDPVSESAYGAPCFTTNGAVSYEDWQREQINTLVREIYRDIIVPARRDIWLSAAVWHTYIDRWGWGYSQGYRDYYQDSQGWVKGGYIDAIAPMIYSSNPATFPLDRWQTLVSDFQANRGDRYIIPGIGSDQPFQEIANRITAARNLGTAGHALFSYTALEALSYFDDLKAGPYAVPAAVPDIPWHD